MIDDIKIINEKDSNIGLATPHELWNDYLLTLSNKSKNNLFNHYFQLARIIAINIFISKAWTGLEFDDCLQLASMGLLESIERFKYNGTTSFETYASYRIRGTILNGIINHSEETDFYAFKKRLSMERMGSLYEPIKEKDPNDNALLDSLIDVAVDLSLGYLLQVDAEENDALDESPYSNPSNITLRQQIYKSLSILPKDQQLILKYHYYYDVSFHHIAEILGITKSRVSQLHKIAIHAMKKHCSTRNNVKKNI